MLLAALRTFRRLGFVGALLLALATALAPMEGQALQADRDAPVAAAAVDIACEQTCDADRCGDCATACAHGCCHAPHTGVMALAEATRLVVAVREPRVRLDRSIARSLAPPGLERPPRA